jgi:predicted membrane chloride channel (bestrophin family)
MITKRCFNLWRVFIFIWHYLAVNAIACLIAYYVYTRGNAPQLQLPFAAFTILGSCIAIMLGFYANACYARWWEARQLWGNINAQCRIFSRLIVTFADAKRVKPSHTRLSFFVRWSFVFFLPIFRCALFLVCASHFLW